MKRLLALAVFVSLAGGVRADTPQIDYVSRVFLPAGHTFGLSYAAEPTAPALYATRSQIFSLDLDTGVFSLVGTMTPQNAQGATATYTSSLNGNEGYLDLLNLTSFKSYDLSSDSLTTNSAPEGRGTLFGQGAGTFYVLDSASEISSHSWNGVQVGPPTTVYTSAVNLVRFYIQDDIAIALSLTSGQYGIQRIDLTTGTLINSFDVTGTFAQSVLADSEGNIYVGNNQGGAYVYDSMGQPLTSFAPGAGDPTDPNLGSNAAWMFLNTAGDLLVMDDTGLHQYAVVPESGTGGMLIGLGAGALAWRRHRTFVSRQG
jgi:hypothetical protein